MKNRMIRMTAILLAALILLSVAGCAAPAAEIDGPAVLQSLLRQVRFDTELSAVKNPELYFPELPEGTSTALYTGSGYYADELALLTLADERDGQQAMKIVEEHIGELCSQFQNYVPEEVPKIDHAVISQYGRYIFVCVTNDYAAAARILENADDPTYQLSGRETMPETTTPTVPETTVPTEHSTESSIEPSAPTEPAPTETEPEVTEPPTEPEATQPTTEPEVTEPTGYPVLHSKSGKYSDFGNANIRVDGSVFEEYDYVDSCAQAYADIVNKTAAALDGETTVYALAIPTAIGIVLPDDIAAQMPRLCDQGAAIEKLFAKMSGNVVTVNCFDNLMRHRDEYLYFRTDHHWNGRGAYYAYETFCQVKGIVPVTLEEREERKFTGFLGSFYQNGSGSKEILAENPDTVYAYCPKSGRATMRYTDKKGNTYNWNIISDVTNWKASTKYSTFAGADNPIAVFTNPDVTDGSVCVIVKESYGNALLPYLVDHYSTIYEIDYRYWTGSLVDFAREKDADDLIFANNLSMIRSNLLIGKLAGIAG